MKTITMTIEQYNAIRRLKDFAQWYIEEHEGGSFISDDQWKEDRDDVARGVKALDAIDNNIDREYTTPTFQPAGEYYDEE